MKNFRYKGTKSDVNHLLLFGSKNQYKYDPIENSEWLNLN